MENRHDIAIKLEKLLCNEFGISSRPRCTIFDADRIETDMFYDDMALLLFLKGKKDYTDFLNSIYLYKGKNMSEIGNYIEVFEQFKSFID